MLDGDVGLECMRMVCNRTKRTRIVPSAGLTPTRAEAIAFKN